MGFGLAQSRQATPQIAERTERQLQGKSELDSLRTRVAMLWQMREGTERLLEIFHGFMVGRPCHGLLPRLPTVRQGLVPPLSPQGMLRQTLYLLGQPVPGERLQGLDDPSV